MGPEVALEVIAGAGATLAQQQALVGQTGRRDGVLAGQRMIGCRDEGQGVGRKRHRPHRRAARRRTHDRDHQPMFGQARMDTIAVLDRQAETDVGIARAEFGQQARHEVLGGADRNDVDGAGDHAAPGHQFDAGRFQRGHHFARTAREDVAGGGQPDLTATIHQHLADDAFELAQLHRHCGLGDVQPPGGHREAAGVGDRQQGTQLLHRDLGFQFHKVFLSQIQFFPIRPYSDTTVSSSHH